jgi:K+-sensing histidine kinase KdpD
VATADSDLVSALRDAMHDVREFNRVIKANTEMLSQLLGVEQAGKSIALTPESADNVRQQIGSVLRTAQMLTARLDLIDYETNPEVFGSETKYPAGIYGKFDKARKILLVHVRRERVSVRLEGASFMKIEVYSVFDALPFLLLENAVKYSPTGGEVVISFAERPRELEVRVRSMGPHVLPHERTQLFDKHFRGVNAKQASPKGNGFGLYFAAFVAGLHGFGLSVVCGEESLQLNGVPYAPFEVVFTARSGT